MRLLWLILFWEGKKKKEQLENQNMPQKFPTFAYASGSCLS